MTDEKRIAVLERLAHTESKWPGTEDTLDALDAAISALRDRIARQNPRPLTLQELQKMAGEPVYVQHIISPASNRDDGEWLILKSCQPDISQPYVAFKDSGLCVYYYGQSWLAYRTKPEPPESD
ncbi:hypothetical protein [Oscillibacter ruminantium]|uniref:hypothetical protein n=1 Tax=Oscillibacter ruminantium TaxID=1263547 RepID=UPI00031B0310|nr:hypothetical protein [Oscillibacter ruminantium]